MTGSNVGSWNDSWSWSETYYGSGSGSGSGSTSSDSGSSSGTVNESYSETGIDPGYYAGAYSSDNSGFDGHYGGVGTGYGSGSSSSGIDSIIADIYSGTGYGYGSGSDHAIDTGSDSQAGSDYEMSDNMELSFVQFIPAPGTMGRGHLGENGPPSLTSDPPNLFLKPLPPEPGKSEPKIHPKQLEKSAVGLLFNTDRDEGTRYSTKGD